jgi:cation/acetate symporter
LFGLDYSMALTIVGIVMPAYVIFGGMIATTRVQIVKAVLLLAGALLLAILVLIRFEAEFHQLEHRLRLGEP